MLRATADYKSSTVIKWLGIVRFPSPFIHLKEKAQISGWQCSVFWTHWLEILRSL